MQRTPAGDSTDDCSIRSSTDLVRYLCAYGATINQANQDGAIALTLAVSRGQCDVVLCLCAHDVDFNLSRSEVDLLAVRRGYLVVTDHVFDVNTKDKYGKTLLSRAAAARDTSSVWSLAGCGADLNIVSDFGVTALFRPQSPGIEIPCDC
jgi:hypothetical protein